MHKLITAFIIFYIAVVASFAQNFTSTVISASGGYSFNNQGYSISYTIGEIFIQQPLFLDRDFYCEGFQQGIWWKVLPPPPLVRVYPNPVDRKENVIKIDLPVKGEIDSYIVTIVTMTGRVFYNKTHENTLLNEPLRIDFRNSRRGMYFVKIQSVNGEFSKTYKIEKL